ncbi:MAG: T9SS type A sorting domain-containing protein [Bacteroidia bacterium]|nr:T9SS type A sorting domain-containing protein [Bacteroidia bacterium]
MKKNIFIKIILHFYFIFILSVKIVTAQSAFSKTYGTTGWDEAYDIEVNDDGTFIIAGSASINNYNIYLVKINSVGTSLWVKDFGNTGDDGAYSITKTNDGGYIAAGWTNGILSSGDYDMYIVKIDSTGSFQWEKAFGTVSKEWANEIVQSPDGGYLAVGFSHVSSTQKYGYVVKLNSGGDTIWTKIGFTTVQTKLQEFHSVKNTSDGGFILCGIEYSTTNNINNVLLIKVNSAGGTEWSQTYGGSVNHMGYDVLEISDGYVVAGKSFVSSTYKPMLLKTDSAGTQIWKKYYSGSAEYDEIFGLENTNDKGFLLTGKYKNGNKDVFIIKTNSNGIFEWSKTYGGTGLDIGYSGKKTIDGGYIIAGSTTSQGAGQEDFYIIKTDAAGQICNNFPSITVTTNIVEEGNPTIFTPNLTGGNGNLTFIWTGDDGFSSADSVPSYIFPSGAGNYYYSVIVTDNNGCVGAYYCNESCNNAVVVFTTSEYINESDFDINIYPNPFKTHTYIYYTSEIPTVVNFEIYDILGNLILQSSLNNQKTSIDISSYPDGIYTIKLNTTDKTIRKKLIKID